MPEADPMTPADLAASRAICDAATKGPWISARDGNQYVNTAYLPTAKLVGASKVEGLVRPWNPHKLISFGFKPEEYETSRFLDEDADFIAHARTALPAALDEIERLRAEVHSLELQNEAVLAGAWDLAVERKRMAGEIEKLRDDLASAKSALAVLSGLEDVNKSIGELGLAALAAIEARAAAKTEKLEEQLADAITLGDGMP